MTTELVKSGSSSLALPSFVRKGPSGIAESMGGGLTQSMPSISLRNSRFHFRKDGNEIGTADTTYLDVVIVGASDHIHRAYYEGNYDPNSDAKPVCTSHTGEKPDVGSSTKQHDSCQFCKQNVKQPDPRRPGKDHTPCGFSKDIAVMIPGDSTKTIWRLKLSSMTVFNRSNNENTMSWKGLVGKIESIGADIVHYVIRLSFDTEASVPVLVFSVHATVGDGQTLYDEAFYNIVMEKVDAGEPKKIVGDERIVAEPVGTVEHQTPAPNEMPVPPAPDEMPVPPPQVDKAVEEVMDQEDVSSLLNMFK